MTITGQIARDSALALVERNASVQWKRDALEGVGEVALRERMVTSDLVWTWLEMNCPSSHTHEHRALGAILQRAYKLGIIEPTDTWALSTKPQQHARPLRVWRSLLFKESP